ncbi:ABC transporter ATP-binding protein [Zavarzinia aquatilis]|uniref:Spermidine/putrescine ABC transporter ATP-binding protein n=1 Tax=Zavarzinia aquatilis TaxID=2211142 RepID=A0A317EF20_9PROT|nr:ABC transporter ATP-binding protein [Zavarzinia aquatilis]PWR25351.1 spermidine/putrescine ABC transporter ATP-binding protein [Zavarzinia aquatilis]
MSDRPLLELRDLSKRYGRYQAVAPAGLEIGANDFFAILGPSGCGKTTLLRMIGGFVEPSGGTILIDGQDVTHLPPEKRPTGMVFQNYGLFPHMTVRQNIAYGLKLRRRPRREIETEVERMMDLVHLTALADRPAPALSGGQRQRVALARALVLKPKVLLLDEPLAALDLKLRKAMHQELRSLHQAIGGTFILVSHDQAEVMTLANRVAVMNHGRIIQEGPPREIYSRPADAFVSGFVGEANMIPTERRSGRVEIGPGASLPSPGADGPVTVMIRPEHLRLGAVQPPLRLEARVLDAIFLGAHAHVICAAANGRPLTIQIGGEAIDTLPAIGEGVTIGLTPETVLVLEGHS